MDPLSITALVISVVQLTGACLKSSGKFLGSSKHNPKGLQELTVYLYSFNAAVSNLQTHLDVCEEDQARLHALSSIQKPLEKSMESLTLIKTRLEDTKTVGKYLRGVAFDKKLGECLESLDTARKLFDQVLQLDNRNITMAIEAYVRSTATDVQNVQRNFQSLELRMLQNHQETKARQERADQKEQDDEERKVLDWLSPLDFASKQCDIFRRRHEGTGAWFLNSPDFQNWVTGRAETLFCPGIPGAGKTVIASISIEYLENSIIDEGSVVVGTFCNSTDEAQQKSSDIIASLLRQLVQRKGLTDELKKLYERYSESHDRPRKQLSDLLQSTIKKYVKVFIVVDALDECPKTERDELIDELQKLKAVANVLVTSRKIESIELAFRGATHLEIHALNTDLEIYIRSKTQEDRRLKDYMRRDPSLQETVVETIVGNAKGMFLLVQLHMETLAGQFNMRDLRKALSSPPEGLDEAYDQIMKRIQSQREYCARLAGHVLAWITNARRPFSVKELQHALAISPGDNSFPEDGVCTEEDLVDVCAGLVTVDRASKIIRLVHYTAQGYLERRGSQMWPTIQQNIAETCITYLELSDFRSEDYMPIDEYIELSDRLRSRYPFLDYAGRYWGHHARGPPERLIAGRVARFLSHQGSVFLTCALMDDSSCFRNFGPFPPLTICIYFGLEWSVSTMFHFDDKTPGPTCAIRYRDDDFVFFMVERDAYWHDDGEHAIGAACSSHRLLGNENIVRILAKKGVNLDFGVENGGFLWAWIAFSPTNKYKTIADLLLDLGATCDRDFIASYNPVARAITVGDDYIVTYLVRVLAAVNEKDQYGRDPLIYAALARNVVIVRVLLEAGADVHSSDRNGLTALCAACEGGNERIVKLLLRSGADRSAEDKLGRNAISIATENKRMSIVRLLNDMAPDDQFEDVAVRFHEARSRQLIKFVRKHKDSSLPESKFMTAARKRATKYGFTKKVPAFMEVYFKEKDRECDPSFSQQDLAGLSESEIIARRVQRAQDAFEMERETEMDQHIDAEAQEVLDRLTAFLRFEPYLK